MIIDDIIREEMSGSRTLSEQHVNLISQAIQRGALYIQQSPERTGEVFATINDFIAEYKDFSHQSGHVERALRIAYYKKGKFLAKAKAKLAPFPNHSFERLVQEIEMDLASAERLIRAAQEIDSRMKEDEGHV